MMPARIPPTNEMNMNLNGSMVGPKNTTVTSHPTTPIIMDRLRVRARAASMFDLRTLFFLNVILNVPMCIEVPRREPMEPKMFPLMPIAQ